MKVKIYQIDAERGKGARALFMPLDDVAGVDPALYDLAWEGELDAEDLDDVYEILNLRLPDDYRARSLSVSDIIVVPEQAPCPVEPGAYYVDDVGFVPVDFPAEN